MPDAAEGSHFGHADFRVGGKIFATLGLAHLLHHDGASCPFPIGCNFENGLVTRFLSTRVELEISSAWA
jgi:hypothetical protein